MTSESAPARRHGFGLAIDLLDGVACDALPAGHGAGLQPPTAVRLVAAPEIDAAWPQDRARTTRELRLGGALVFSVAHAAGAGYLLTMPGLGRFLIDEAGTSVACSPTGEVAWARALMVQALPLACTLRGLEPFHASGVVLDGGALMLAGAVTAGKSSLAAHLVEGGATLLSDDVVALDVHDGTIRAHPGGHRLHLRAPEADRVASARRLRPGGSEEGRQVFDAPLADCPAPMRAVYLLERGTESAISEVEASGVALLAATYNLSVREPSRLRRQLELAHRLSETVPTYRLVVAADTGATRLAEQVRAHFEETTR